MKPERIGELAYQALITEVEATPKPGLVDRQSQGAHRDMDINTFYRSADALHPHFVRFAELGRDTEDLKSLLPALRRAGLEAEEDMFAATEGVNTHKGALFSIGLICGAAGYLAGRRETITVESLCEAVRTVTAGICDRELGGLEEGEDLSRGQRMYLTHGVTGVRGEAEGGFPSVREIAMPAMLEGFLDGRRPVEEVLCCTLVALMAGVDDTNVLARHDEDAARYVRKRAREVLDLGCSPAAIRELDEELTERYISPGGAADLLAVTIFLFSLQENLEILLEHHDYHSGPRAMAR